MFKIVSGGQTGVDRAALDAAQKSGVACGGWCPKGRTAEDGPIPDDYPLVELDGGYIERTLQNVLDSDVTVILHSGELRGGTRLTRDFCIENAKPFLAVDLAVVETGEAVAVISAFLKDHQPTVVNFAGPRASGWPEGYALTYKVVSLLINNHSEMEAHG